jgi:hypothetical protein
MRQTGLFENFNSNPHEHPTTLNLYVHNVHAWKNWKEISQHEEQPTQSARLKHSPSSQ